MLSKFVDVDISLCMIFAVVAQRQFANFFYTVPPSSFPPSLPWLCIEHDVPGVNTAAETGCILSLPLFLFMFSGSTGTTVTRREGCYYKRGEVFFSDLTHVKPAWRYWGPCPTGERRRRMRFCHCRLMLPPVLPWNGLRRSDLWLRCCRSHNLLRNLQCLGEKMCLFCGLLAHLWDVVLFADSVIFFFGVIFLNLCLISGHCHCFICGCCCICWCVVA